MTENRIHAALAGPGSSPAPIVKYEYEDAQPQARDSDRLIWTLGTRPE